MSIVWHIGDTHFGHANVGKFRDILGIFTSKQNDEMICDDWTTKVKKKDLVFVHGDAAFNEEGLSLFSKLVGRKILILGNHDELVTNLYLENGFERVVGVKGYKECWLTHIPIHSSEFRRAKLNIHGHTHLVNIEDDRYFNVSCDELFVKFNSFLVKHETIKRICGIEL